MLKYMSIILMATLTAATGKMESRVGLSKKLKTLENTLPKLPRAQKATMIAVNNDEGWKELISLYFELLSRKVSIDKDIIARLQMGLQNYGSLLKEWWHQDGNEQLAWGELQSLLMVPYTSLQEEIILLLLPYMPYNFLTSAVGKQKLTPLMIATYKSYSRVVQALLKLLKANDLTVQDTNGDTALMLGLQYIDLSKDDHCNMLLTIARAMNSKGLMLFNKSNLCAVLMLSKYSYLSNTGYQDLYEFLLKNSTLSMNVPGTQLPLSLAVTKTFCEMMNNYVSLSQWQVQQLEYISTQMSAQDLYKGDVSTVNGSQYNNNLPYAVFVSLIDVSNSSTCDHLLTLAEKITQKMVSAEISNSFFDRICQQTLASTPTGFDLIDDVLNNIESKFYNITLSSSQTARVKALQKVWLDRLNKSEYGPQVLQQLSQVVSN